MSGCVIIETQTSSQNNVIGSVKLLTTACASDVSANNNPAEPGCQGSGDGGNTGQDAGAAAFVSDNFNDTNGTTLTSHTGATGATWTKHPSSGAGSIEIDANRAHQTVSTNSFYYASGIPGSADYDVQARLRQVSDTGVMGITGRMSTSANTMYRLFYTAGGTDLWTLDKVVAGTGTTLATWSDTLANGDERTVRLQMQGSSIKGFIDGVERLTATDSAITAAGKAGVRGNTGTSTTGSHLDWFQALNHSDQILLAYRLPTANAGSATINTSNPSGANAITFTKNAGYGTELESLSAAGSGMHWVGYVSEPIFYDEFSGLVQQFFTVQPNFTIFQGSDGSPYQGPFNYRVIVGEREVNVTLSESRAVDCGTSITTYNQSEKTICADDPNAATIATNATQSTRDLGVIPTDTSVHTNQTATVPFNLKYAGDAGSAPAPAGAGPFTVSASTDVPNTTATPSITSLTPATDSDNNMTASVPVPGNTTAGTYHVTVTATLSNGQTRSGTANLSVGSYFALDPAPGMPSLPALTLNGTVQTKTATMSSFGVNDTTTSPSGWNVTVIGDTGAGKSPVLRQYCPNSSCGSDSGGPGYIGAGYRLAANSLTLDTSGASWSGGTGATPAFNCNGGGCAVDSAANTKIASAANGSTGTGLWTATGFSSSSLSLTTPSTLRTLQTNEQYRLNVVWTLNSGP
jgi:hypothetical protein